MRAEAQSNTGKCKSSITTIRKGRERNCKVPVDEEQGHITSSKKEFRLATQPGGNNSSGRSVGCKEKVVWGKFPGVVL